MWSCVAARRVPSRSQPFIYLLTQGSPDLTTTVKSTDEYIESLVCPPPPSDGALSEEMIGKLIVPSPLYMEKGKTQAAVHAKAIQQLHLANQLAAAQMERPSFSVLAQLSSGEQIAETLLKSAEQVTHDYCLSPQPTISHLHHQPLPPQLSTTVPLQHHLEASPKIGKVTLTDAEKMKKVILELVDTERTYVEVSDMIWPERMFYLVAFTEHYLML